MTETILTHIKNEILNNPDDDLTSDEDLLSSGLIDSLGVMSLIGFLEETYGVKIPPEDMTIENFISAEAIENYLTTLKNV